MSGADFRDLVREKLANTFGESSPEDLCRVLFFLDRQDNANGDADGTALCPYWKSLKALLSNDRAFDNFAQRLADDTKTAEEDPQFIRVMHAVYDNWMTYSETPHPEGLHQGFDLLRLEDVTVTESFGFAGLARAWGTISCETQKSILAIIPTITSNRSLITAIDDCVSVVNKVGGQVVMYSLAAVYLSWEAYKNIKRWWRGDISGKRCVKNVIDAMATTAAGVGGGIGGAALGTFVGGPIGAVVGGIVGGIVASNMANILSDRLTQWVFGVPKSEALENAYNYLKVKPNGTNAEVNTAFRKLCLKHHPDKGGNQEEFFILQNYMAVIKMAREGM